MATKVSRLTSSMVVKETTDSAWPKFAEWAITQTNPHLPNIYDLQVGDTTFATMERLIQFRHIPAMLTPYAIKGRFRPLRRFVTMLEL